MRIRRILGYPSSSANSWSTMSASSPSERFLSVRELYVFYTPQPYEIEWVRSVAGKGPRRADYPIG